MCECDVYGQEGKVRTVRPLVKENDVVIAAKLSQRKSSQATDPLLPAATSPLAPAKFRFSLTTLTRSIVASRLPRAMP